MFFNLNSSTVNGFFKDYISELYHFEGYLAESFDEVNYYTQAGDSIDPETMFYPDYAAAQDAFYLIQNRASASVVKSLNTGAEIIDEILLERRKELVGEGFGAVDILRTGSQLNRPEVPGPNWATDL